MCEVQKQAEYAANNWDRTMLSTHKRRAKECGLEFNLDLAFLRSIKVERCPVFGFALKYEATDRVDDGASLDRIDNNKGYVKGNVQYISGLANRMKSTASAEQLVTFAEWVLHDKI